MKQRDGTKMALKDWKQSIGGKDTFAFYKKRVNMAIYADLNKKTRQFDVYIYSHNQQDRHQFKSKLQALNFAKNYMRKEGLKNSLKHEARGWS